MQPRHRAWPEGLAEVVADDVDLVAQLCQGLGLPADVDL